MQSRRPRLPSGIRRRLCAAVALAAILVSCSARLDSSGTTEPRTPLEAAIGATVDPAERAVSIRDEMARRADAVAHCMREQGFEYVAWVPSEISIIDTESALPTQEYVARYGYGISTRPDLYRQKLDQPEDPNAAIQASLSPDEAAAYQLALTGIDPTNLGESPMVVEAAGCIAEADRAVTPNDAASPEDLDTYYTLKNQMEERIAADPQVLSAIDAWRSCMAADGYTFTEPSDAQDAVYAEWKRLVPDPAPEIATPQDASILTKAQFAEYTDASLFDQLVAFELRLAGLDYQCQAQYRSTVGDVRERVEKEFVAANADLISRISASMR